MRRAGVHAARDTVMFAVHGGLPASFVETRPARDDVVVRRDCNWIIRSSLRPLPLGRDAASVDASARAMGLDLPEGLGMETKAALVCYAICRLDHNLQMVAQRSNATRGAPMIPSGSRYSSAS
jgi:hypothetical protein